MDHTPMEPRDVVIDVNSSVGMVTETRNPDVSDCEIGSFDPFTVCGMLMTVDELTKDMNSVSLASNLQGSGKKPKKGKCPTHGCKKPSKPPRPPRGLSRDAADVKLIQEITELAKMKRSRIERMKALKKMKTAKSSSTSMSPTGNWIALLFTILFCVVIILQGCHPSRMKPTGSSAVSIQDSATLNGAKESYAIQEQLSFLSSNRQFPRLESPGLKEPLPSSDNSNDEPTSSSDNELIAGSRIDDDQDGIQDEKLTDPIEEYLKTEHGDDLKPHDPH